MYTIIYANTQINGDTHGEVMSNIGIKQWCPLSVTIFNIYIDELETYLDNINEDSSCLSSIVVAIILYDDNVALLLTSESCLQRFMNKLYEFCIFSSLNVNWSNYPYPSHNIFCHF